MRTRKDIIKGFKKHYYWSSYECATDQAWTRYFVNAHVRSSYKDPRSHLRATRIQCGFLDYQKGIAEYLKLKA